MSKGLWLFIKSELNGVLVHLHLRNLTTVNASDRSCDIADEHSS